MNSNAIMLWLQKKRVKGGLREVMVGVLAAAVGLVVLFLTFWFSYAVIYVGWAGVSAVSEIVFGKELLLTHAMRTVGSGVFLSLLFVQNFSADRWYWGDYPKRDYVAAQTLQVQAGALGSLAFILAYPGASANMITDVLLSGPRLITFAGRSLRNAMRWIGLDISRCADLLVILLGRSDAVPYDELQEVGTANQVAKLNCLDGVLFLAKGVALSPELRSELGTFSRS